MRQYINLLTSLPNTRRPIKERKIISEADKALHWKLSLEYFDGTRSQGYGGYKNDGRWDPVAKAIAQYYHLTPDSTLLDVGCAKGFLLESFRKSLGIEEVWGLDISLYALQNSPNDIQPRLVLGNSKDLPFDDGVFDLVISINSLHNILNINDVIESLKEIQRVSSGRAYVTLGAFKNAEEKLALDNWAVVATTYLHENDWLEIFDKANYSGDYFWFKPTQSFGKNI